MDKPWKVIFAFVAVFIAGAVFGGLFTLRASGLRLGELRPKERSVTPGAAATAKPPGVAPKAGPAAQAAKAGIMPALMRQFTQRLKLTPVQRDKIRPIVGRASDDLQRLRQDNDYERQRNLADTARVTDRMYSDVAALLSPDQRDELETMRGQMQERVEKERKRRAEINAAAEAAMKAERASASQPSEGDAKAAAPVSAPTAKPPTGGK